MSSEPLPRGVLLARCQEQRRLALLLRDTLAALLGQLETEWPHLPDPLPGLAGSLIYHLDFARGVSLDVALAAENLIASSR